MSFKYDEFYKDNPHGLGEPFPELVEFFNTNDVKHARVLDIGCGQGRDALFIARLGHTVVGVDISPTGIEQMHVDAKKEKLDIVGVLADITKYEPEGKFDVILIDRTLHMILDETERLGVLNAITSHIAESGFVLIADEKENLPAMQTQLKNNGFTVTFAKKGFLFAEY